MKMFLVLPLNDALFSIFIPYILQMNAFLERVQLPISRKNCFKILFKDKPVRENALQFLLTTSDLRILKKELVKRVFM